MSKKWTISIGRYQKQLQQFWKANNPLGKSSEECWTRCPGSAFKSTSTSTNTKHWNKLAATAPQNHTQFTGCPCPLNEPCKSAKEPKHRSLIGLFSLEANNSSVQNFTIHIQSQYADRWARYLFCHSVWLCYCKKWQNQLSVLMKLFLVWIHNNVSFSETMLNVFSIGVLWLLTEAAAGNLVCVCVCVGGGVLLFNFKEMRE